MKTCSICKHPQRAAIEAALVQGLSYRHIASQFGVGYKSVQRHRENCMPQEIAQAQQAREEVLALNVKEQLVALNTVTLAILKEAREAVEHIQQTRGDSLPADEALPALQEFLAKSPEEQQSLLQRYQAILKLIGLVGRRRQQEITNALQAIDRAMHQLEIQAKLQGDLAQEGTVNIWLNEEWGGIRKLLLDTLRPYPEARMAVAQALLALENEATSGRSRPA
jgi:hypothetical protein